MEQIQVENFRCFRAKQQARLAPLTLLMGENSTGKTSLLALIRAMHDLVFEGRIPDFKEPPYDLGSFDEIAHHRGSRGGRATRFEAAIRFRRAQRAPKKPLEIHYSTVFERRSAAPFPVLRRIAAGKAWTEVDETESDPRIRFGTPRGVWTAEHNLPRHAWASRPGSRYLFDFIQAQSAIDVARETDETPPVSADRELLHPLLGPLAYAGDRPFASGPVRSRPRRTYNPRQIVPDAEGAAMPMYLADLRLRDKSRWDRLRKSLEQFGVEAGLFDEIQIKRLGKGGGAPFQVQVRKFDRGYKGPPRNLIDVGYGVSQVLPVLTELVERRRGVFLLQQPEVHLHPSAQAALGSLFCRMAGSGRQIIVETHSDHLMDRIRMDVRDGNGGLGPEDFVILYFERRGLDVRIHEVRMDQNGNVRECPDSYRSFFLRERTRSLGL